MLGLCFLLLYSCPVKKYLLLTYGKGRADESATCQFQRGAAGHCERIAYLRRPCLKSIRGLLAAAIRPATPPALHFFSLFFSIHDGNIDHRENIHHHGFDGHNAQDHNEKRHYGNGIRPS